MREIISSSFLTTFVFGALSGYAIMRYRLHMTERSSQINDHLKDIEKLVDASLLVVSSDGAVSSEKSNKLALYHAVARRLYPQVKEVCHSRGEEYQELMLKLFALVTADERDSLIADSGSTERMLERPQEIVIVCGELTNLLREVRRDSLSVSVLLKDIVGFCKAKAKWFHDVFLVP